MCNPCPRREMEPLCEFQTHHQAFDHLSRLPDGTALLLQEWGLLLARQRAAGWVHILNSQMLAQPAEVEGSGTLNHQFFFQLLDAEKLLHLNLDPFYEVLRPLAELLPELCHDVWPDQEQDTRLRGLDELDEGDDHRQDMCQVIETLGNAALKVVNKISTGNWSNDAIWKELENAHDAMGQAFQRKFPRFASSLLGHAQSSGGDELCRFLHCHLQGHTVFSEAFAKSPPTSSRLWVAEEQTDVTPAQQLRGTAASRCWIQLGPRPQSPRMQGRRMKSRATRWSLPTMSSCTPSVARPSAASCRAAH